VAFHACNRSNIRLFPGFRHLGFLVKVHFILWNFLLRGVFAFFFLVASECSRFPRIVKRVWGR
jgi:hypothetical protein